MSNKNNYPMPNKNGILVRASQINNGFIQSAFPTINPTEDEAKNLYKTLGIGPCECAYCGKVIDSRSKSSLQGDHVHSIINREDKTKIYLTDISNVLPCCSDCNGKKSNLSFEEFYTKPETKKRCLENMSEDEYNRRYDVISEYSKHSHYIVLDDEDIDIKNDVLEIKDDFCALINKIAIDFGENVLEKNGFRTKGGSNKNQMGPSQKEIDAYYQIKNILEGLYIKKKKKKPVKIECINDRDYSLF